MEQGVPASPLDPQLEGRLTVEGSELVIKKVQMSDSGVFRVSDLAGFHVADIYINVVGKGKTTPASLFRGFFIDGPIERLTFNFRINAALSVFTSSALSAWHCFYFYWSCVGGKTN